MHDVRSGQFGTLRGAAGRTRWSWSKAGRARLSVLTVSDIRGTRHRRSPHKHPDGPHSAGVVPKERGHLHCVPGARPLPPELLAQAVRAGKSWGAGQGPPVSGPCLLCDWQWRRGSCSRGGRRVPQRPALSGPGSASGMSSGVQFRLSRGSPLLMRRWGPVAPRGRPHVPLGGVSQGPRPRPGWWAVIKRVLGRKEKGERWETPRLRVFTVEAPAGALSTRGEGCWGLRLRTARL